MPQIIEAPNILVKLQHYIIILSPLPILNRLLHLLIHYCGDGHEIFHISPESQRLTHRFNLISLMKYEHNPSKNFCYQLNETDYVPTLQQRQRINGFAEDHSYMLIESGTKILKDSLFVRSVNGKYQSRCHLSKIPLGWYQSDWPTFWLHLSTSCDLPLCNYP